MGRRALGSNRAEYGRKNDLLTFFGIYASGCGEKPIDIQVTTKRLRSWTLDEIQEFVSSYVEAHPEGRPKGWRK